MDGKKRPRTAEDKASIKGLGRTVRELREAKGWRQDEVADRAELNFTTIYAVERGACEMTWGNLRRLAEALDVDLDALIELAEALAPGEGGESWRRRSWVAERGRDLG